MSEVLVPDICILGAGAAGLSLAAAAAGFGLSVVLVEKGRMGGDCLNTGCVPSKALIAAAGRLQALRDAAPFGVRTEGASVDMAELRAHLGRVIAAIAPNDSAARFTGLGVRVIEAAGRFLDPRTVIAGEAEIRARRFVVATGASPVVPPIPGLADVAFLTNETVFELAALPSRLVVLGAGAVGLELAQAFRRLGSEVVVLEAAAPLGGADPELVAFLVEQLREEGVDLRAGARVSAVRRGADGGVAVVAETARGGQVFDGSHLLVAAGRRPDLVGLGLDAAGIAHGPSGIAVDAALRTTNRRCYAIGDVTGGPLFTHWAGYQAGLVLRAILFRFGARLDPDRLCWAVFTDPELAQVGLDEAAARARHGDIRILRWPYWENDRAQTERATRGLVKVIATRRGRVVGAQIVGRDASEQIALWTLAVSRRLPVKAVAGLVLPYPTRSEAGRRAALSFYTPMLQNPWLKRLVRLSRLLG